ncbi:MAG: threonylcarbamoyl-AMP synthase [Spirochaetes bacterium]|nr:threonylcarbamoyl-AMP synthase [Spirochaetota bacterium]
MNRLVSANKRNIIIAAKIIRKGGLVAFPTETVYGLGADAFNEDAVLKIFEAKKRPSFDPLIVHIADPSQIQLLSRKIGDTAEKLIKKFWPGPLTLILEKRKGVPDIVTSGLPTVAIRMPSHPVALRLIQEAKSPIAAPSANRFSYITPTRADVILKQLGDKVDLILDDGHTHIGIESTILSLIDEPKILRPGGLAKEEIEKIIGKVQAVKDPFSHADIESPGQMKKHYAPGTPAEFITEKALNSIEKNSALLLFKKPIPDQYKNRFKRIEVLSSKGDLHEAAKNLFALLYKLDEGGFSRIYVQKVPYQGIGIAIMDRLRKATQA